MGLAVLPRPVGFVLGGGGSLGAIQVGMLHALADRQITPDLVTGTSVGSLNGAVVALDPAGAPGRLTKRWTRMTRDVVFPGGLIAQARTLRRTRTHLFPNTGAVAMGARSLVVLDCNFPGQIPPPPETLAETLLFSALVTMRTQAVLEAPVVAADMPVVYLPGPPLRRVSPLKFDHTEVLIEGAYQAARSFLEDLDVTGAGLYGSPSAP